MDEHRDCFRLPARGLPLTAFEEHMLLDDRASHPMVIVARFDFSGPAPLEKLHAAFDSVVRDEPLLSARIHRPRFGRPRWVPGSPPLLRSSVAAEAASQSTAQTGPLPSIDPFSGPPLRAELLTRPGGWSVVIAVHHAACDGLGLMGFVERWLLAAASKTGRRKRNHADAMAALRSRGRVAASWIEFARMLPRLKVGLEGVQQYVARRVMRLDRPAAAGGGGQPSPSWEPRIVSAVLEPEDLRGLERRARAAGVMVNDLLIAAMITAVAQVAQGMQGVQDRGETRDDLWIRIGVPISLRTKSDHALPAANRVSMVFIDRQPAASADHEELVAGIHAEMELIRSHALGHIFPLSLEVGRLLPGGLQRTTESSQAQSTAVLSNLGRCFHRSPLADGDDCIRVGDSCLDGWWMVPPVRPGTAFALATHETSGRRTLALHADPAAASEAEAAALLDRMVLALRERFALPADEGSTTQWQAS